MRIKYDNQLMKLMYFFESRTHARLKDCFLDNNKVLTFVVSSDISKAIGRNGANARSMERALNRKIRIVAFAGSVEEFVRNLLMPLKAKGIEFREGIVTITPEPESRGYIIGRAGSNLRNYEAAARRYFDVKEIKVV
ncbi:NusA-like transcription termination signal-binding factor [Candidatus Woesearchaeota archaeon]|nr:NusA-like transcription termination signal-binding factor [Candidatus Woesearchaeota archaeon]